MFDKRQEIYTTNIDNSIDDAVLDIFSQVDPNVTLLKLTFFHLPADDNEYLCNIAHIKHLAKVKFGKNAPLISYVAQKPFGSAITAEALYLDEGSTIERRSGYILIECGLTRTIVTEGITPDDIAVSTYEQSHNIFGKISAILTDAKMKASDIYRQWNYIQDITEESNGRQNYQELNDARSLFYEENGWRSNYPAATGIGTSRGGVMIEIMATSGGNPANCPIDNPLQTAAHVYSQRVLIGNSEEQKTTPKFERARIAGENIYISGTAAIRGEESLSSLDITGQTEATMQIMNALIAPDNIPIPCRSTVYDTLRVYVKREEDILPAQEYLQEHYPAAQKHFVVSDVCRPELLIEIEGTAHVVFV